MAVMNISPLTAFDIATGVNGSGKSFIADNTDMNQPNWASIKGHAIQVQQVYDSFLLENSNLTEIEIKRELTSLIAQEMMSGKYIEFTRMQQVDTGSIICRARAFLVPGDMVQLLRVQGVIE
jgi:predicted ABC-type ATPase